MARKNKKAKQKTKRLFNGGLVKLTAVAVIVGCAGLIIATEKDCAEKNHELELIDAKITSYRTENEELQRVLDSNDMSGYMEKVALEERGYAYPDERRFYDTTRD